MARHPRFFVPGQLVHAIQRGNNRATVFYTDEDRELYCAFLAEAAEANGLSIHAYVLMGNHAHLLATPESEDSLPRALQSLGRRYVRHINAIRRRTGTLWEGRYRAAPVDSEEYFFSCCRYIELNPVRARLADHPRRYRWSSYRAHAEGEDDPLAAWHPMFRRLGRSRAEQQEGYRALFREPLDKAFVDGLRAATNGGWAFGDEAFRKKISRALRMRVAPLPRGRKPAKDERRPPR
ncbi:MAG TPA: transposase [Rhizomicrobium sp.]|jgi:putative transposase|nr:transposase [Rhizomicrobium sp.]